MLVVWASILLVIKPLGAASCVLCAGRHVFLRLGVPPPSFTPPLAATQHLDDSTTATVASTSFFTRHPIVAGDATSAAAIAVHDGFPKRPSHQQQHHFRSSLLSSTTNNATATTSPDNEEITAPSNSTADASDTSSLAMISTLRFYKQFISPLLPPACRFVPTCSQYGVQAIQEYGPAQGVVLIAWRLLRCSPVGGKGYDPPRYVSYIFTLASHKSVTSYVLATYRWPPVPFTYSSY